ncbi:MAG: CarD-like/TRCF domain protein [Clostridia bacterium]|nr:CarD-like/TRCF domain protein [Clostridia bacterium]NCC44951.1 CarD-like/TRCF domain protein [Clostridia bacterium]
MLNQGEMIVYKSRGVYEVEKVGRLNFSYIDRKKEYYTLHSVEDEKEMVYVPASENEAIRKPMTKDEALQLITEVREAEILWIPNEKMREQEYRHCISSYEPKEWIRILKTLYQRTRKRGSVTSMDKKYQQVAERALYSELAYALGVSVSQVGKILWDGKDKKKNQSEETQQAEA